MEQICVVTTVVDAREAADILAAATIAGRLAACAQVGGQVDSTYWWGGAIETAREWSVQLKTAPDRADAVVAHVLANHPYEVPEVLVSLVDCGNPAYAKWVQDQTAAGGTRGGAAPASPRKGPGAGGASAAL